MNNTPNTEPRRTIRISVPVSAYAILAYRAALAGVTVTDYVATTIRIDALTKKGEPSHQNDPEEIVG